MITPKRVHFRRVLLFHGLLLALVIVTVYFSSQAQYQGLKDQAFADQLSKLQTRTRFANQSIEASVHVLSTEIQNLSPTRHISRDSMAWDLASVVDIVDRQQLTIPRAHSLAGAITPEPLDRDTLKWAAAVTRLEMRLAPSGGDPYRLYIASPTQVDHEVAIAIVDPARLASLLPQAEPDGPWGIAVITDDQGTILASPIADYVAHSARESFTSHVTRSAMEQALTTRASFGQIIAEKDDATLFAASGVDVAPDITWHVILSIPHSADTVRAQIQPVIEQLAWWAMLILIATALVLVSTTYSLVQQRRRIEQLRSEMLNRDLAKARRIQLNWLPKPLSHSQRIDIAAENIPALHISGDFYNWFELPPLENESLPRTAIILGDVSGHGLPAAFLMATTQMLVKSTLSRVHDPGQCLTEVNNQLCSFVYGGQFVTLTILVIDHEKNKLTIASAGQTQPLVRRGQRFEALDIDTDLVLGVNQDVDYRTYDFDIDPSSTFILYTDGIIEAVNEKDEPFGMTRLVHCLNNTEGEIEDRLRQLYKVLTTFRGEADPADDQTLVGLQLHPTEAPHPTPTSAIL